MRHLSQEPNGSFQGIQESRVKENLSADNAHLLTALQTSLLLHTAITTPRLRAFPSLFIKYDPSCLLPPELKHLFCVGLVV